MVKKNKRQQNIKNKLIAAIAMLLVSSIMMVSSTYAWFTLSTAPEVTGITTSVGANGNLEMALLPKSGSVDAITSSAGDSTKQIEEKNVTWGNLVDVSDDSIYGLNKITLYPAQLNITDAGKLDTNSFLKTPKYGADGRVSELAANTVTGYYNNSTTQNFTPDSNFGVRAVGTASGMTDRQLSYRNARSAANTAASQAANKASISLNTNGSALANIAIEYGMGADTASFDKTDVAALRAIINDLQGEGGVLDQIETAYMQYILAYAASAASGEADTVWSAVKGLVEAENATLSSVVDGLSAAGASIPDAVNTGIAKYNAMVTSVGTADTALIILEAELATDEAATFTWTEISSAMTPLANPSAMEINGIKANEVKEKLGDLVTSVTEQNGLNVIMKTGAGVYADIADQSGDYTASIVIDRVEYNGIVLNNMKARMKTQTSVIPATYLKQVGSAVELAGAPAGTGTVLPISDMYGYIIDLAFRTNAAESNLLLQVDATDRIYGSDNTNEQTAGHGSTMTFMATATDFSNDQVKSLMDAITIVFFNPEDGTIYSYGGLDTATAVAGAEGVTAEIYLYKLQNATTTTYTQTTYDASATGVTYYTIAAVDAPADAQAGTLYVNDNGTYKQEDYAEGSTKDYFTFAAATPAADDGVTYYAATTVTSDTVSKVKSTDDVIIPLTQNQAHKVSVLVYLDGNNVSNGSVAATASTSMTGKMNIQFASSATLIPMEYADLHINANAEADGE